MDTNTRIFSMGDIPYDILQEYGISQQMVDDLPEEVIDDLLAGKRTPPLPVMRKLKSGKAFRGKASLVLVNTGEGVNVMFIFRWEGDSLDSYNNDIQNALRGGYVVRLSKGDDSKYAQLDSATNRVMKTDGKIIDNNIETFTRLMGLPENVKNTMMSKPCVTFSKEYGEKGTAYMTSGIDLHSPSGILSVIGDEVKWNMAKESAALPHYNWGLYGCWEMAEDGTFDKYIPEEEYTDEMYNEMHKEAEKTREDIVAQQHL